MTHSWHWYTLTLAMILAAAWIGHAPRDPVQVLAAVTFAGAAIAGARWYARFQSARRLSRVLDLYVERILAGEDRRKAARVRAKKSKTRSGVTGAA